MKRFVLAIFISLSFSAPNIIPAVADTLTLEQDHLTGYNRSLFKLWIDADKNGCNTRAEVLISEAIVKPKIGKKCALAGGTWISPYDEKATTRAIDLDIDHVVPLAEAWRSGAWKWTPTQRQDFANDLTEPRALVAVSLSLNRSKGDKDVAQWLPEKGVCTYIEAWITVKIKYALTADSQELDVLQRYVLECNLSLLTVPTPMPTPTWSSTPTTSPSISPTPTPSPTPSVTVSTSTPSATPSATQSPTPTPSPTPVAPTPTPIATVTESATPTPAAAQTIVSPGAFCSPAGATGVSKTGVSYTCKTSATDTRNRWLQ